MNTEPNNQPERVKYIVSPPAPAVNIERDEDMEAKAYIILDEDQAAHVGGHFGIVVYFDQEPEAEIIAKALEAVRALRARVEA